MTSPKNWEEISGSEHKSWKHKRHNERITIEDYDGDTIDKFDTCASCGKALDVCECCEIWCYDDVNGICDNEGVFTNYADAKKEVLQIMSDNPNGCYNNNDPDPEDKEVVQFD